MMPERIFAWNAKKLQDGHDHRRDWEGTCRNCGASAREPHYLLRKKEVTDE